MDLYVSEFINGMMHRLKVKKANVFETANDSSILPTIQSQAKWQYAKSKDKLELCDGNIVHVFNIAGDDSKQEDFPLKKDKDIPIFDFKKNCSYSGTAQIHRSDPGMVYLTLHDGKSNPTYTFRHVSEEHWRAIPKKKSTEKPVAIEKEAFLQGLKDMIPEQGFLNNLAQKYQPEATHAFGGPILDNALKGADALRRNITNGAMWLGKDPLQSAGIGLGLGAAYDLGKRTFYNTPEENEQENGTQRAFRYLAPTALLGGAGYVANNFTDYHKFYPTFKQ